MNVTLLPFTTTTSLTAILSTKLIELILLPFSLNSRSEGYRFPKFLVSFAGVALKVEGAIKSKGKGLILTKQNLIYRTETLKGSGTLNITNLNYYL
jgi:hypothetical protein